MRLVVLADVHGNLAALEAAVAGAERWRPDLVLVAGDVVDGGPDSAGCWERVKRLGCPVLRGNHERYVFDYESEKADPAWREPHFAPLHVARGELSAEQIAEMAQLPMSWTHEEAPGLLVVHASLRSDADSIFAYSSEEQVEAMFPGLDPGVEVVVRGHNHQCATRAWGRRRIVTSGSVGMAQDGNPAAQFVRLEWRQMQGWSVFHHAVPYDVEATLRRFRESGYLERAGPMGRLFYREVATGTHQVVPFLRFQAARRAAGQAMGLEEAVSRFLAG